MSETICNPCPDFTCACPVPECTETLILGTITDLNTDVLVYVQKLNNGASRIQSVTSSPTGSISLDMTDRVDFYNHFDGEYYIWATKTGYWCDGSKLEILQAGITTTTYSVTFTKSLGAPIGTTVEIIPTA